MNRKCLSMMGLLLSFLWFSCQNQPSEKSRAQSAADSVAADSSVARSADFQAFTLKNTKGSTALLTNFGARLVSLRVPNKAGKLTDVVLGFNTLSDYHNREEPYFGAIVGPVANRIAHGQLSVGDTTYQLPLNNGEHTLHGGFEGLHFAFWKGTQSAPNKVTFGYVLPAGHEGFPGNLTLRVSYTLNDANELVIHYEGQTDAVTYVNLSNHAYFNLNGEGSGSILQHELMINADTITPVDKGLIPTGELRAVAGTAFDFRTPKAIGRHIQQADEQLEYGKGYDHNFVLNQSLVQDLYYAARVVGDRSGIQMDIYTQEPGIQFYSGNFMANKVRLKNGETDAFRTAFCLEPQHFPDAPNQPNFPSIKLEPGQTYRSQSIYKFSIKK